jgi:hypothetical protein
MRFYYFVLLAAASLLSSSDALESQLSKLTKITTSDASQWGRALISEQNGAPAQRFLRERETAGVDEEERGNVDVVVPLKKFFKKVGRLALYHKWALDDKVTLEWVRLNRPKYYNSYKRFWVKRFV